MVLREKYGGTIIPKCSFPWLRSPSDEPHQRERFRSAPVRAIACIMVVFQHVSLTPTLFAFLPGKPTVSFHLGVELFFVISGYVVTRSLFSGVVHPVAFLARRFFRLTPAILTFLLFSLIVFTMIASLPSENLTR